MSENLTWEVALERLKDGNGRFVEDKLDGNLQDGNRRGELTEGQAPFAIILSCADSRVVPEFAFDAGLGEIFVLRVAGNIANSSTIASIEYAIAHLGVNLIAVVGHEGCGAVTAAIAGGDNGKNLNHLVEHINPALEACDDKELANVVKKNAELTAQRLVDDSDIIKNAQGEREIKILPAYYNLSSGKIDFMS